MIAVFTAFTLAFSALWAMSPEAVADAIKSDSPSYLHELAEHDKAGDHTKQAKQSPDCNHGCHMAFHLLGFAETNAAPVFALPSSQAVIPFSDNLAENPYLQGPFRPPLAISLA